MTFDHAISSVHVGPLHVSITSGCLVYVYNRQTGLIEELGEHAKLCRTAKHSGSFLMSGGLDGTVNKIIM